MYFSQIAKYIWLNLQMYLSNLQISVSRMIQSSYISATFQLQFSWIPDVFSHISATFQLHFRHISAVQLAKADVRHPIILPFCIFSVFLVFQWKVLCSVRGATSIWDGIISIIQFARKRGSKVWVKAGKFDLLNVFNFSFLHTFNIHLHIRKGNNICLPILVVD